MAYSLQHLYPPGCPCHVQHGSPDFGRQPTASEQKLEELKEDRVVGFGQVHARRQQGLVFDRGPFELSCQKGPLSLCGNGWVRQAVHAVVAEPLPDFSPSPVGP